MTIDINKTKIKTIKFKNITINFIYDHNNFEKLTSY